MTMISPNTKFTPAMRKRLAAFLANPGRPEGTLHIDELEGYLFAIVAAPAGLPPSVWVRGIFAGGDAVYEDEQEAQSILVALMTLYNHINAGVLDGDPRLSKPCRPLREAMANFDAEAGLGRWARGFVTGQHEVHDVWQSSLPPRLVDDWMGALYDLSFFAYRDKAARILAARDPAARLEDEAEAVLAEFDETLRRFAHLGRSLYLTQVGMGEPSPRARAPARSEKVGRNEPCPCGSGRKFKQCCGAGGTRH